MPSKPSAASSAGQCLDRSVRGLLAWRLLSARGAPRLTAVRADGCTSWYLGWPCRAVAGCVAAVRPGRFVRIKDARWATAMQACVGQALLNAFVVYDDADLQTLRRILNEQNAYVRSR